MKLYNMWPLVFGFFIISVGFQGSSISPVGLIFQDASESIGDSDSSPTISGSGGLWWGSRMYLFAKLSGLFWYRQPGDRTLRTPNLDQALILHRRELRLREDSLVISHTEDKSRSRVCLGFDTWGSAFSVSLPRSSTAGSAHSHILVLDNNYLCDSLASF